MGGQDPLDRNKTCIPAEYTLISENHSEQTGALDNEFRQIPVLSIPHNMYSAALLLTSVHHHASAHQSDTGGGWWAHLASLVSELDEAEALELTGLTVSGQTHVGHLTGISEESSQCLTDGVLATVPVKALHEDVVVVAGGACTFQTKNLEFMMGNHHVGNYSLRTVESSTCEFVTAMIPGQTAHACILQSYTLSLEEM